MCGYYCGFSPDAMPQQLKHAGADVHSIVLCFVNDGWDVTKKDLVPVDGWIGTSRNKGILYRST